MASANSPKCQVFHCNFDRLVNAVAQDVGVVARKAFSNTLITDQTLSDAENQTWNEQGRASKLLQKILKRIEERESLFDTFVTILEEIPVHQELAIELKEAAQSKLKDNLDEVVAETGSGTNSTTFSPLPLSEVIEERLLQTESPSAVDDTSSEQLSNPAIVISNTREESSTDTTDLDDSSSSSQRQDQSFVCPCGNNCSFDDYIGGNCVPIKELFPYINTKHLSESEKDDLQRQLLYAAQDMLREFQKFVGETFRSLKGRKPPINQDDFREEILTLLQPYLPKPDGKGVKGDHFIDQFGSISKTRSYLMIHKLISFFNFQILEDIITLFGTTEDTERLETYKQKFCDFCRRSVFEVPPHVIKNLSPTPRESTFKLVVKINEHAWFGGDYEADSDKFVMEEVYTVQRTLAKVLELKGPRNYILFIGVRKGCVELTFLILSEAVTFKLNPFQIEELSKLGIKVTFQALPVLSLQKCASFYFVNTTEDVIIIIEVRSKEGSNVLHYLYLSGDFKNCEEAVVNLEESLDMIGITKFDGILVANYDSSSNPSQLGTLLNSTRFTSDLLLLPSPYCNEPQFASLLSQYKCTRAILPDPTCQYEFRLKECPVCFNFAFQSAGPHAVLVTERKDVTVITSKTPERRSGSPSIDKNLNALHLASQQFQNRPCNILVRIDDYDKNECAFLSGNVPANSVLEHLPPDSSVYFLQVPGNVNIASKKQPPIQQLMSQAHSFVSRGFSKLCFNPSQLLRYLEIHGVTDMYTVIETENNTDFQQLIRQSYKQFTMGKDVTQFVSEQQQTDIFENKQFGMILKKASLSCCKTLQSLATASEFAQCLKKLQDSNITVVVSGRPSSTVVSGLLKFLDEKTNASLILMNTESVNVPVLGEISILDSSCTVRNYSSSSDESAVISPRLLRSISEQQTKSNTLPRQAPKPSTNPRRTQRLSSTSAVQHGLRKSSRPKLPFTEKHIFQVPSTKLLFPNKQAVETKTNSFATSSESFLKFVTFEDVESSILHEASLDKLLTQREQTLSSFVSLPSIWNNIPLSASKPIEYHRCKVRGVSLGDYLKQIFKSKDSDDPKPVKKTITLKNVLKLLLGPGSESQLDTDNLIKLISRDQPDRSILAKRVLATILEWEVKDGVISDLKGETKFHLTPTESSAYAASIVVTKFVSDLTYHDGCVVGALIQVDNAKSKDLQVVIEKLKTFPPKPDLNFSLNFKLVGMCGTTLADCLYERGWKEAKIVKTAQLCVGEVLALVLNPQRALKIMLSFPLIIQQCIRQIPFNHALSIVNMEFLEQSRHIPPEARWELVDAFIKTKKQKTSILVGVSVSTSCVHTIELTCKKAFSLQIKQGYKVIDCGVEIANEYTFNNHSGKLICVAEFTCETLPEMTLIPSLKISTFTDILLAFDLPNPRFHDGSSLKIPLLDIPLSDLKSLNSPALTLTQVSPHLPEMVVSRISFTVGKKNNALSTNFRQLIDQNYLPDVFINFQEHFKPSVSILNPYGKVPEMQLTVHFTAEVRMEAGENVNFNMSLTAANTLDVSLPQPDMYTLTITNSGSNYENTQRSVLLHLLTHFCCPLNVRLPTCVQEMLSKLEIRRLQLSFSTTMKTLQCYEMYCSVKQFDIMKDALSAKEVFVQISYSRSEGVKITCKGLVSLLGSEWFPLDFSLPTIDKPVLFKIDSFVHELSLLSLLKSPLWGMSNQESEVLLKHVTPDTRAVLSDLGMFDTSLLSLQLEIIQCTDDTQRSMLIVSNAIIKLNVVDSLKLGDLIQLEDVDVTVRVVKESNESSNCYQTKVMISGSLCNCLHLELFYSSHSCCFTGTLSVNTVEAKKATALCVVENVKAGNSTELWPIYKSFEAWTRQITVLVTKFLGIQETKRFYDSLNLSHAELSIRHVQDHRLNFVLDYLQIYIIDLIKDHHNAFEITDLQFEYFTSEDSQLSETEDHQPQENQLTCAILTGVLFVGNKRLKVVFDLRAPSCSPASESKELTCTIQPMSDTESLSLSTLIEIARCNQPQLPDIEIPTNIYDLDVKKGFVVFGFSPFRIKRFDVFLSATPNWIVNEAPFVEFENVIFRILFDSEKTPENACQVSFECILVLCDTPLPIVGFVSKQSIEATATAQQDSEAVTIDFQNVLNQWPPTGFENSYQLPTDINLPHSLFTLSRLSLDILLEKEFKQVKFEASTSNKWLIKLAGKSSNVTTTSDQPEMDSEVSVTDHGKRNEVEFSSLGYFLNFQVSNTSDGYLALLFGELQLSNATLESQMILGTDKLLVTAFICKDDLGHELSLPSVADQFVTENVFTDPETSPKLIADRLVPSVALLHIDIRTKHLIICGKLKDSASSILYLKYSQEREKFLCTVVLVLDQKFKFTQISESLAYVDDVMSVTFARLMITNEDRPLTSVLDEVSTTTKGTCDDYKLYEIRASESRIPLPSKVTKDHKKCTHVRSSTTDNLVKDIGQSFTLWPYLQKQSSYADPLQPGFCLYAAFDVKCAESTSPPIKTALDIIVKPDLRDTQLVVIAKCSNVSDDSKAAVKFSGHFEEIELSGSLIAEDVVISFEMTKSRLLHNLLMNCILQVQPKDESLSFKPLSFFGNLEIDNEEATFHGKEEHSDSTLSVSQFEIDPCKTGSQTITNLSIVVKYDNQFWPLVIISGFAANFLGFLEAQAELILIGSVFRLFRINITTEADFYAFLEAQNLCNELLIDRKMITIHTGELYFSRCCDGSYQKLPDVDGKPKPYRENGLWLTCDASLLNEQFFIEVCFPVSGNKFAIMGGKKEKVELFGFINLTNDTFFSGPQLELTQSETGSAISLNVGVELWNVPWFKGKLTFKPNGGKYVKSPGFEASIDCVKKIFKHEELKVAVAWSLKSGFEIHEFPLNGTLDTLMSLSGFLNQWQIVARLAYALINMSRVRVSIKGNLRMETSERVPEDCRCLFVWDGMLNITGKNNIKIEIELPEIPIAIRRYDPARHPNLISYLFDCLWASTDKIAKSVLNYLCSSKRFYSVMRGVIDTLKQTVKNVKMFIPKQFHSFGIGKGNSFWVLNEKGLPVAYCEHHDSESPYARLFGRPLAMKAIQEVATVLLSNARATNELAHENGPSSIVSSTDLDAFEKYIYQIKCKAEKWSKEALKVDYVKIDVEKKTIKWKMSKTETELEVKDLIFHVKVIGTLVLESPSFELQENVLIFETPPSGIEMKTSKDTLTYADGWLVLDLVNVNSQSWDQAVCIAASVYASVVNNVTVLPPSISEETAKQVDKSSQSRKERRKKREQIESNFKMEGWKNEVHIRGSCCYAECMAKELPPLMPSIFFNDDIKYISTNNQIVGSVKCQLPSSSYCVVQLYNTENSTDILWQKLLQDENFSINMKELPTGSSSGPYKLRTIVVASICSLESEFVISKFEISRCNSPQCIRQKTKKCPETVGSQQEDVVVQFSWKEPDYFQQSIEDNGNHSEFTDSEHHKVDHVYKFSGKLKESGLVLFDGSTRECEFQCQLKDLFEKHSVPFSESINLSFEVVTLGDTEKLDSIPSVTEFIVLSPPTDMEVSPPNEDFGVHMEWKFAANAMSYLIKLVNTSTGLSKTIRNHIPEQRLGKKYLKGTNGDEKYAFDSEAFVSNTEDDIFVVHSENEESSTEIEPEEHTDTLALLSYVDLKQFLQMEPSTYKIEMFSSGDGDKCIQSLTSCESSNEEKIEILSSEVVQLRFDYKTDQFIVVVQSNQVFANGHVVELLMENKDENESQATSTEYLAKRVVSPNHTDSTIHTIFKKWKKLNLRSGTRVVTAVSSTCVIASNGVSCTLAKSYNTLKVLSPPSNVMFTVSCTSPSTKANLKMLSESTSSEVPDVTSLQTMDYQQAPIQPSPFEAVFNTIDDLIVTHSSGRIVASWEGEDTANGAEFVVGFISKTKNLYRTFNSSRKFACIDLDRLQFHASTSCQLFVQLADNRGYDVTSPFAFSDHWFHCIKAEVRVNRQWKFSTLRVVFTTESVYNIHTAALFRNCLTSGCTVFKTPAIKSDRGIDGTVASKIVSQKHKQWKPHIVKRISTADAPFEQVGSTTTELSSIRFKLARKLIRKLKCKYAFVYDMQSSDQYEYLVCQSSRQAAEYKPSTTTARDKVTVQPKSRANSKSDKPSPKTPPTPSKVVTKRSNQSGGKPRIKPPVPAKPHSLGRSKQSPSLTDPAPAGKPRKGTSPPPQNQSARKRSGSQQSAATSKSSDGTNRLQGKSSKAASGTPNVGKTSRRGSSASVTDSRSKDKPSETDKPPSEPSKGIVKSVLALFESKKSPQQEDSPPKKSTAASGSPKPQRECEQRGGAAKKTRSSNTQLKKDSSGKHGSPARLRPSKNDPLTSTKQKLSKETMRGNKLSPPSPTDPDQLLDEYETVCSKWVFVEPCTYEIILKASKYNIECPLSVARSLSNGNITTLVQTRKLWFALIPANEAIKRQTGFEKQIKICKELNSIHSKSWGPLAVEVGLPADKVKSIALSLDPKVQKSLFIKEWSKRQYKPSWGKLVLALRSLELHKVAINIWKVYAVTPGKGYLPMFYHDLLGLGKFNDKDSIYTVKLEDKHFKHPTLSKTTQSFSVLIHARCRPSGHEFKKGPTWFKLTVAIYKQTRRYIVFTKDNKLVERSRSGRWGSDSGEMGSISRALLARHVKPKDSESLVINLKVIKCEVEAFEAIVVPS